jgi:alpha-D-ribose 1-methylphosphonate 5-phosphate C-P lyase
MSASTQIRSYTQDVTQILKTAGAVTASAASGSTPINVGAGTYSGVAVIDVTALTVGADNAYDIIVQGSDSSTFASGIENLSQLNLGNTAVRDGGAQTSTVGRYELPFTNENNGNTYAYVRLYTKVAGTSPSINYGAYVGLDRLPR